MMQRVVVVGTGLIGASIGLALRRAGYAGEIAGVDTSEDEAAIALQRGAIDRILPLGESALAACREADVVVLAVPVLAIMHWIDQLGSVLSSHTLVTDTGSTKLAICEFARKRFAAAEGARFLPGHPMAGKESGGAALAEAELFDEAMWLFTPLHERPTESEWEWRGWVEKFGSRTMNMDAARHDKLCAWVSHLPQMVSTAMSAMFADEFKAQPELEQEFHAIGGRALREMTRLGASPYSMWRDVAMTNTQPVAATLFALEQRLAHMRENLKTPELREEFVKANQFRS